MNKLYKTIIIIFLLTALIGIGYLIFDKLDKSFGSVGVSDEYLSTSTAYMSGVLVKTAEFNQLITAGVPVLGSVVIASTTAASMTIYDATSTAGLANGDSIQITRFPTSTPQGTYTFDTRLDSGLVITLQSGFAGDYVITYRRD